MVTSRILAALLLLGLLQGCQLHNAAAGAIPSENLQGKEFRLTPFTLVYNWFMGGPPQNDDGREPRPQPIMVIGAGLPRTGTSSFRTAMGILGLKCYHFVDGALETPGHIELWTKFLFDKSITADDVLDGIAAAGFNATTDTPTVFYYKDQIRRYPNAKVVLTVRDSPEEWAESFGRTIGSVIVATQDVPYNLIGPMERRAQAGRAMFEDNNFTLKDSSKWPQYYTDHLAEVKASVPADNLLVFNVKEGWKPLCEFLSPLAPSIEERCGEISAMDLAFPHINDTALMLRLLAGVRMITMVTKALPLVLLIAVAYFIRQTGNTPTDKKKSE